MRKVFFGGSFDPPHYGHLGVARAALASRRCDEVVWFPAAIPPHKMNSDRASFAHRMNMVKLLIAGEEKMSVSDFEERSGLSPSYTIDVLDKLEKETGDRYALLIGADSLLSLHTWHKAAELVEKTEFIIYPRAGSEVSVEKLQTFWDRKTAERLYNSMLEGTFFEISSTELKNSMEKNSLRYHIIEREKFPPETAGYIRQHNLYQYSQERMIMTENKTRVEKAEELANFCIQCAEDKKAEAPALIKLPETSGIADFFVIATANSEPHLQALAHHIERQVREKFEIRVISGDDSNPGGWVLLDFNTVIVHLMLPEIRDKYQLETLWGKSAK